MLRALGKPLLFTFGSLLSGVEDYSSTNFIEGGASKGPVHLPLHEKVRPPSRQNSQGRSGAVVNTTHEFLHVVYYNRPASYPWLN
jgi:hypothetical protein